jgi:hypothetical protein
MGNLFLAEALDLVCLYAEVEPAKFENAAVKWLRRFIDKHGPSLLRAKVALAALSELREGSETAERMLRDLCASTGNEHARGEDANVLTRLYPEHVYRTVRTVRT